MSTPKRPSPRVAANRRTVFIFMPILVIGLALTTLQSTGGTVTINSVFILGALISVSAAMAIVLDHGSHTQ